MGRRCPKGGRGGVDAKLFVGVWHFVFELLLALYWKIKGFYPKKGAV